MEKVSNCCGVTPLDTFDEVEVCPKCLEHCAYIPEIEFNPFYVCEHCDKAMDTPVYHNNDAHHYIPIKVAPQMFCSEECRDNELEKNYDKWISDNI
jgi:hypothetical protein